MWNLKMITVHGSASFPAFSTNYRDTQDSVLLLIVIVIAQQQIITNIDIVFVVC